MKIINCVQGSPEWYLARCGMPTTSCFDRIINLDGKPSKQREKYLFQLGGERIIGHTEESYTNGAMERGKVLEAEAREFYEFTTGKSVLQVGLCVEGEVGASPDGLVDEDGSLEIKCPTLSVHISYLIKAELPSDYFQQTQGQLLVTDRKYVDFLSYYPGLKPLLIRVEPNVEFQKALKKELESFCSELNELTDWLKEGR